MSTCPGSGCSARYQGTTWTSMWTQRRWWTPSTAGGATCSLCMGGKFTKTTRWTASAGSISWIHWSRILNSMTPRANISAPRLLRSAWSAAMRKWSTPRCSCAQQMRARRSSLSVPTAGTNGERTTSWHQVVLWHERSVCCSAVAHQNCHYRRGADGFQQITRLAAKPRHSGRLYLLMGPNRIRLGGRPHGSCTPPLL